MSSYYPAETVIDEEDVLGRCVTVEELIERLRQRRDIFFVDRETRLTFTEGICLTMAVLMGLFLSTRTIVRTVEDQPIPASHSSQSAVSLKPEVIDRHPGVVPARRPDPAIQATPRPIRRAVVSTIRYSSGTGVGDPRSRIAGKGIFEYMSKGKITGVSVAVGDPESMGGVARGLDAILQGTTGLKTGGGGGTGRTGLAGIGFADGAGTSGFDGGTGIDDVIAALMNTGTAELTLRQPVGPPALHEPVCTAHLGALTGGRSQEEIMRILQENMPTLRYAYNRWLRTNPTMHGKITIRFAIDEFGKVLSCEITNSFTEDAEIRSQVVAIIRNLRFDKIDKVGDLTEVVYPLVFSR